MKVSTGYAKSADGEGGITSSKSSTRSVAEMKNLLPLQLASPLIPTSKFTELRTTRSFSGSESASLRVRCFQPLKSFSSSIATPSYRDIPIYAPKDSPVLEQAYFTPGASTLSSSHPNSSTFKPFIINDYELTDCDCEPCDIDPREDFSAMRASYLSSHWKSNLDYHKDESEMRVFKADLNDLFQNEAAWLSSPLNSWNDGRSECLPYVLSQSMPLHRNIRAWFSDTGSCPDEDDGDILACATALASSKANVIEVNKRQAVELSVSIPPRSSSLGTTFLESSRLSWMTFGARSLMTEEESLEFDEGLLEEQEKHAHENEPQITTISKRPPTPNCNYLLGLKSPPSSPQSLSSDSLLHTELPGPSFGSFLRNQTPPPKHESLHEIISDLENHLSAFPSKMLLDTSNCTSAMRNNLRRSSRRPSSPRPQFDAPPSPALSLDNNFPRGEDQHSVLIQRHVDNHTINGFGRALPPTFKTNLEPLRRIFPDTSNFMRSALYAHLLAYIFTTSLNRSNDAYPAGSTVSSLRPPSRSVPSKAVELLGMTEQEKVETEIEFEFPSATKSLEDLLMGHIGTLVGEMERSFDAGKRDSGIGRTQLMSLVELVRVAEGA